MYLLTEKNPELLASMLAALLCRTVGNPVPESTRTSFDECKRFHLALAKLHGGSPLPTELKFSSVFCCNCGSLTLCNQRVASQFANFCAGCYNIFGGGGTNYAGYKFRGSYHTQFLRFYPLEIQEQVMSKALRWLDSKSN